MGKNNGLGYTRVTIPDRKDLTNKTTVITVGGKKIEDWLADLEDAFKKSQMKEYVNDVTEIPQSMLNELSCGDQLFVGDKSGVNGVYCYQVAYKLQGSDHDKQGEIKLVYVDASVVNEVYYEKTMSEWTYVKTDTKDISDK